MDFRPRNHTLEYAKIVPNVRNVVAAIKDITPPCPLIMYDARAQSGTRKRCWNAMHPKRDIVIGTDAPRIVLPSAGEVPVFNNLAQAGQMGLG